MEEDSSAARERLSADPRTEQQSILSVGQQATRGVLWLTAQKWAARIFSFVTIIILTRLLSPADFGTVAAASTVLPFFYVLSDLGFAAYIVQVEKTNRRMLSTAFWFSMSAGLVLCVVLFALAPLLGQLFGDTDVISVMQVLSLWVLATAVGSVPMAIMRREMRFAAIAGQATIAALAAQVVAIIMAFSGFGVWALVGQSLTAPVISTVLLWISVRWRPGFGFSRLDFVSMASFGSQVLGVEFVAILRASGEAAVISSTLGLARFGYMNIAQRLVQMVQDLTGGAIVPVAQVAFAKIRDDVERLRGAYVRALRLTYAALSLPLTFVAVASPLIVPIVFGEGWEQSFAVAQILALAGSLSIGAWLDHGLFYGVGKPGRWFVYALVIDALTLGMTIALVTSGLVAIAWGFLAVCLVATVVRWFLTSRLLSARWYNIAGPFCYLVVVTVVTGAAGWGAMLVSSDLPPLVSILVTGVVMTIVHLVVTRLIARSVIDEGVRILARSRWGNRIPFRRTRWPRP
ncbi:lipopolysaccharide biosynthesis protein [Salinibacterium sp.]|uniref:lipopolysaccharide biosynthesis protein n=1 Tax=Salinibacterium sp. TaxID=1915057 RepID=UPI00286C97D3|nr:lipopolysaccharide biosynthesis protein [Salinibacterium sp.]